MAHGAEGKRLVLLEKLLLLKFTKGWEHSAKPRPARFWRRVMLATDQENSGYESFDDNSVKAD